MKISIITAVFNNCSHIQSCIESVLSQIYPEIEYIIIDGGSTDGTKELIAGYRDRINIFISEPDKGIYDALNKGINLATGDIIGILHSDDLFFCNQTVAKIAESFSKTKCDAVYGDLIYVSREDTARTIRFWRGCSFNVKDFRKGWMPAHPTLFMKKKVYNDYGLFNIQFRIAADYDLILRTLGSGKLKCEYLPEIITKMRLGGASNKSIANIWQKSKEDWIALRKNKMGGLFTLVMKNASKIKQFRIKG